MESWIDFHEDLMNTEEHLGDTHVTIVTRFDKYWSFEMDNQENYRLRERYRGNATVPVCGLLIHKPKGETCIGSIALDIKLELQISCDRCEWQFKNTKMRSNHDLYSSTGAVTLLMCCVKETTYTSEGNMATFKSLLKQIEVCFVKALMVPNDFLNSWRTIYDHHFKDKSPQYFLEHPTFLKVMGKT